MENAPEYSRRQMPEIRCGVHASGNRSVDTVFSFAQKFSIGESSWVQVDVEKSGRFRFVFPRQMPFLGEKPVIKEKF